MKHIKFVVAILVILSVLLTPVAVMAANVTHVVQPGETLYSISRAYGVSVSDLASVNGLYWNSWVYVGQRLVIPGQTASPAPDPVPVPSSGYHVVQRGDTLSNISRRYGITVSQLAAANGMSVTAWVYVGQRLVIPDGSSTPAPDPTPAPAPAPTTGYHIVQAGNTLFSIARMYGTTVDAIKATNSLYSNTIYVGQRLKIPDGTSTPAPAPNPTPAPSPGTGGEKWIDIDLTNQRITAYEGNVAVYSVIVSTGTWRTPTVTGTYYIYAKYESTPMSGPGYYLPGVPWTMYFYRGYAIHGTYWHNNFGTPMSHGCVNLRTEDAKWFYFWAPMGTRVFSHY